MRYYNVWTILFEAVIFGVVLFSAVLALSLVGPQEVEQEYIPTAPTTSAAP